MATPVVIHVSCPTCGAQVPGLEPGQRRPCPYCKTELAMPRLDPTRDEMPQVMVASVAPPTANGCGLGFALAFTGVVAAVIVGTAVWGQQRSEAEGARQMNAAMEQVRRAQTGAYDQVSAAQREAERSTREAADAQRRSACELRAAVTCERACRERPAKCGECLPRERAACAAP